MCEKKYVLLNFEELAFEELHLFFTGCWSLIGAIEDTKR